MSLIEKIYYFIKFPKRADEDTFLSVLMIFWVLAAAGWGIVAGALISVPWWVIALSVLVSIVCYVVWYYVDDTLMHFLINLYNNQYFYLYLNTFLVFL